VVAVVARPVVAVVPVASVVVEAMAVVATAVAATPLEAAIGEVVEVVGGVLLEAFPHTEIAESHRGHNHRQLGRQE
jgi:hypothetical protein